jgi:hypothetical protein
MRGDSEMTQPIVADATTKVKGTAMRYTVHKLFIDGTLKGLTYVERQCPVSFEVGKIYGGGWTGPKYRVTACFPA